MEYSGASAPDCRPSGRTDRTRCVHFI